tara:strand:+ start:4404 stop:5108 length:705 start_codon:yes stop_codon:yes gene_type:complete
MKKVVKGILKFLGVKKSVDKILHQRKVDKAINNRNVEDRFSKIYEDGVWYANKESASGSGSTLEVTKQVRTFLPELVEKYKVETLVDVGCGDYNWMKEVQLGCKYIGTDIVKSVVEENIEKYQSNEITFLHSNAIEEKIPEGEIVLCRDVLFHLSFEDGKKLIENIKQSKAKYLVTTSHKEMSANEDIYTGNFRKICLEIEPYNFPNPIAELYESDAFPDRFLGVWDLDFLRDN